ncbi:MAG: T9SS C-terminal target domain-containing protein [Calditrichaeota bacterium]|nr:MAG: T9SS C-terminal target domain-containing protein [Calditrichota bacterium]
MYRTYLLLFALLTSPLWAQSQLIQSFDTQLDTSYWSFEHSEHATDSTSYIVQTLDLLEKHDGTGAMRVEYHAQNIEPWGGYVKVEHVKRDAGYMDWSAYDSVSFWYNNVTPQDLSGRVHLRFELYDGSDVADTVTIANNMEFYYSFEYILDDAPGWHKFTIPLVDGRGNPDLDEWNGQAFNRTGWSGITGNDQLDPDKLRGFAFEFSINGSGEGDIGSGVIVIDQLELTGFKGKSLIIFNGKDAPSDHSAFAWGASTLDVAQGAGATPGTNALQWVQGDGWTGAGYNIPATDLKFEWGHDSLRFKMKADMGVDTMRLQFEDGTNKVGLDFKPVVDDGAWHEYAYALKDFILFDGSASFDTTNIVVFQFLAEGNGKAGNTILFDDFWTGNPTIDVVPPEAPTGVTGVPNTTNYFNLVIWQDVPGESGETYDVYASENPITSIDDPGVWLVQGGIAEGTQSVVHKLSYPLKEKSVSYYYAVTATDMFSNVSDPGVSTSAATNTAEATPTISLKVPSDFVADGDISEWDALGIMPFHLAPSISHVATGAFDDDADMDATGYMAVDDSFLYVAFDVTDNIYSYDPSGNFWEDDAMELYIGLYNQTTIHKGFLRGNEPDYKFVLLADKLTNETASAGQALLTNNSANYSFVNFGASDWAVEARIPLDSIITGAASGDARFHPQNGMQIALDLVFHDSDSPNIRDGVISFSDKNNDNSWQGVENWSHTWIGDTNKVATAIDDIKPLVATFDLKQNYPNPFNPKTTIRYSIAKAGKVKLTVYNVAGQLIKTLVNAPNTAGTHKVSFDASKLASGVYFYNLQSNGQSQTRKMLLVK